jgi:hypothetical protein
MSAKFKNFYIHNDITYNNRRFYLPSPQHKLDVVAMFASHRLGRRLHKGPRRVAVVVAKMTSLPAVANPAT